MKTFVISFIVVTCSIAFVTSTTPVLSCTSGPLTGPAPISVTVNDCTELPCTIVEGSTTNVEVTFTAVNNATNLFGLEFAIENGTSLGGQPINDVCDHLTEGSCPVKEGERITLSFSTTPTGVLPLGTDVSAQVVIFDNTFSVLHVCYLVPLNVVAA